MGKIFISKVLPNNLYYADNFNHVIKKMDINFLNINTIAGNPNVFGYLNDENMNLKGSNILFDSPSNIVLTSDESNIYISDNEKYIRHIDNTTYEINTLKIQDNDLNIVTFSNIIDISISNNDDFLYIIDNYKIIYQIDISNGSNYISEIMYEEIDNLTKIKNIIYKTLYEKHANEFYIKKFLYILTNDNANYKIIKKYIGNNNDFIEEEDIIVESSNSKKLGNIIDFAFDVTSDLDEVIYNIYTHNIEWSYS